MNRANNKTGDKAYQQQILFSEKELSEESAASEGKESKFSEQVIFENQDYVFVDDKKD